MLSRLPGILFLILLAVAGAVSWLCWPHAGSRIAPARFSSAAFHDLPGWNADDPRAALAAFRRSCLAILAKPANAAMGGYGGNASDWQPVCHAAQAIAPDRARAFFEAQFVPVEINGAPGLFTGYYEPLLHGSRTRHGAYQTPVYGLPPDLVSVDLGAFAPEFTGEHISGRVSNGRLVRYATRAQIDATPPVAPVLFYGDDPVTVFFLHIQGSGRVQLDDGSVIRVAYAGQNGRPYTPIGRTLIHRGALTRKTVSMQAIRAWLTNNPQAARAVMESDASYVFFKETPVGDPALGSEGGEGVALTPRASVAVDSRIHPLGAPVYIATTTPDGKPLQNLFVAQDIGGAIRGAVRADIFFGFGTDAERLAGAMKAPGRLFVLLPRALAQKAAR